MVYLQLRSYIQKSTNVMDKDNLKIGALKIYFLRYNQLLNRGKR
jgi:hypothetical protein